MPDPSPPHVTVVVRSTDLPIDQTLYFNNVIPNSRCIECHKFIVDMRYDNLSDYLQNNIIYLQIQTDSGPLVAHQLYFVDGFYNVGTSGSNSGTSTPNNGINFWYDLKVALTNLGLPGCAWYCALDAESMRGTVQLTNTSTSTYTFGFTSPTNCPLLGMRINNVNLDPYVSPSSPLLVVVPPDETNTWYSGGFPSANTIQGVSLNLSEVSANSFNTARANLRPTLKYCNTTNAFGTTIVDTSEDSFWLDQNKNINFVGFTLETDEGKLVPQSITWVAELRFYQ